MTGLTSFSVAFSSLCSFSSLRISRPASSKSCSYLAWLPVSLIAETDGFLQQRTDTGTACRVVRDSPRGEKQGGKMHSLTSSGMENTSSWPDTTEIVRYRFAHSLYLSLSFSPLLFLSSSPDRQGKRCGTSSFSPVPLYVKRNRTERFFSTRDHHLRRHPPQILSKRFLVTRRLEETTSRGDSCFTWIFNGRCLNLSIDNVIDWSFYFYSENSHDFICHGKYVFFYRT